MDSVAGATEEGMTHNSLWRTLSLSVSQEVGGEAWGYDEPVAVFIGGQLLLGGLTQLLLWAADTFCYHDNKSPADYEAVAVQAYNKHISNPQVMTPLIMQYDFTRYAV